LSTRRPNEAFGFSAMLERVRPVTAALGTGTHFWDPALPWNTGEG